MCMFIRFKHTDTHFTCLRASFMNLCNRKTCHTKILLMLQNISPILHGMISGNKACPQTEQIGRNEHNGHF